MPSFFFPFVYFRVDAVCIFISGSEQQMQMQLMGFILLSNTTGLDTETEKHPDL